MKILPQITFLIFLLYPYLVCEAQQNYLTHFDQICWNEYIFNSSVLELRNTGNNICNLNLIKFPESLSNTYKYCFTNNDDNRKVDKIKKYSNNEFIPSTKKSNKTFLDNISCDVSVGYNLNWWEPWMSLIDDIPALKVTTEGLSAFDVHTNFVYQRTSFLRFDYQFPLNNSPDQKEILSLEKYEVKKLKHFTGGISLYPFLKNILKSDKFFHRYILKPVFSFQYKFSQSLFVGRTEALRDFVYIPLTAYYDTVDKIFYGVDFVEAGKRMSFKCLIKEEEMSIALLKFNFGFLYGIGSTSSYKIVPHFFRIGWFNRSWERPSDSGGGLFVFSDNTPVVHEAKYNSTGIFMSGETVDPGAEGINMDFALKLGQNNSIESVAVDFYEEVISNSLHYWWGGLDIDLWWNYYFAIMKRYNFFVSFGCCFELNSFQIDDLSEESESSKFREDETSNAILIDKEWRFDLFLSLSLRF